MSDLASQRAHKIAQNEKRMQVSIVFMSFLMLRVARDAQQVCLVVPIVKI